MCILKSTQNSEQLVCTKVSGSRAISAGLTVGVVENNVTASAAAKAQCTWELKKCYVVYCYANSGTDYCIPISNWTISAT